LSLNDDEKGINNNGVSCGEMHELRGKHRNRRHKRSRSLLALWTAFVTQKAIVNYNSSIVNQAQVVNVYGAMGEKEKLKIKERTVNTIKYAIAIFLSIWMFVTPAFVLWTGEYDIPYNYSTSSAPTVDVNGALATRHISDQTTTGYAPDAYSLLSYDIVTAIRIIILTIGAAAMLYHIYSVFCLAKAKKGIVRRKLGIHFFTIAELVCTLAYMLIGVIGVSKEKMWETAILSLYPNYKYLETSIFFGWVSVDLVGKYKYSPNLQVTTGAYWPFIIALLLFAAYYLIPYLIKRKCDVIPRNKPQTNHV
jgi:hypothetical protein